MMNVRKILAPTDFSPISGEALKLALGLAERFGATVDALHVLEYPAYVVPEMTVMVPGAPARSFDAYTAELGEEEMRRFLAPISSASKVPLHPLTARGDAARAILECAKSGEYDLIVMGTHGRTGLEHVLLGSVAERVVRKAPCPVLTTPGPHSTERRAALSTST